MANGEKTTAARVLNRVIASVGIERLAESLHVSVANLEPFVSGERTMTLPQQRALGLAVLALSADQADLRRQASSLLAQVGAAEDFEAGVTERHAYAPPRAAWR